ncbi:tRNA (adenine(58)-N(1))-methyltransferase non-catalytic subunit TRM6 [Spodoptera frugiperda]|uniref:tRNA (adenine(58)-N(1))-methyltransferase non-catalytic subunit TRM6 n=1 Tax=Spodoptera frugiperda TaxID=7108 RepID=A0A9R0CVN9_SPOFR|nr:tRNA (adenine(58)-N(1))-methyltransferase non-catalytic subunit TRM6 [Spodoptera frugiperda]
MANEIKIGDYIVIQKHNYKKLHKFNKSDSTINLGKDTINLEGLAGCPYFSVFKLIPKSNKKKREFTVELAEEAVKLTDEIDIKVSGNDNRNILDDGRSQKLSAADIETLKTDSNKASDIVETLISNSNTFHNKTEFSQDKYLRKKEKKYFEYFQVLKPNLRIISEIMYKLEPNKIQNLRIDTLSQIITMVNIHCEGNHLLYDSGSNGLVAAALLSAIGENTTGKLVHMHPGNMSQKQALLAMNFPEEQLARCVSVNVYSALRQFYQGCDTNNSAPQEEKTEGTEETSMKRKHEETSEECPSKKSKQDNENEPSENDNTNVPDPPRENKKPKWHFDNIAASEILQNKMDSLVIACKEDPQNIFNELVSFVKPGRPFVIYYNVAEPLQQLYMQLKMQSNVAALKLTCNWMRNYQVLPDRTHPEVTMNASSGFLLSGYVLK